MLAALAATLPASPLTPSVRGHGPTSADLGDGRVLIVAGSVNDRDQAMRVAAARSGGAFTVSRSRAAGRFAVLLARAGQAGLDMETLDRIVRNATPQDPWLAPAERVLVERSAEPTVELACHWVLKEAYGKALGVGLDLRLVALAFGSRDGTITLEGIDAPGPEEGWSFGLFRDADTLFGTACRSGLQTATPLAPAGRKPPRPLPDR